MRPTPGPWWLSGLEVRAGTTGSYDIIGYALEHLDGAEANARLMAAAPDLLEALKAVHQAFCDSGLDSSWTVADDRARAAIAKAEGAK